MQHHFFLNKLILIFRYLAAEEDTLLGGEQMLFEILHFDFFQIPRLEIAKISVEVDALKRKGENSSIRLLLKQRAHRPPVDLFDTGLHPGLIKFSDALEALPSNVPVQVLFDRMSSEFGIVEYAAANNLQTQLAEFSSLIETAASTNPGMLPGDFVSFIDAEMVSWLAPDLLPEQVVLEPLDRFFVSQRLEKFVMNVSALNNYLQCPLHFYYQNLLRIPSGKSEALGFGSAIHHAVEKLFEKMKLNPGEVFPSKLEMIEDFRQYMNGSREIFTQESFERKMAHGTLVIGNYYDRYINYWKKIVLIESNIRNVKLQGVPLKGKLDKIEFTGNEVNIVDYKTGNHERAIKQMERPNEENPVGGNYWRQAVFYHLLVELRPGKPWIPVSTEFDFIEADAAGEFLKVKLYVQPADKETVTQQIIEIWEKIQSHDFYTGCGKQSCHWCGIARLGSASNPTKHL